MFLRGTGHTIPLHLVNTVGDDIEESDGAPTVELSTDYGAYDTPENSPIHIDEDLWTLELSDSESTCNNYTVKVTHALMVAPYFVENEAWFSTLVQDEGGAWELKVINDIRGAF